MGFDLFPFLIADNRQLLERIREAVEGVTDFSQANLEPVFQKIMDEAGIKFGKIAQPLRVAITGRTESPGIFETMTVLGRPEVAKRLAAAIDYIKTA